MSPFERRPAHRRSEVGLRGVGIVATLLGLWIGGMVWFVHRIPDTVEDPDVSTDAIVVLTGAGGRLASGLELLAAGKAHRLFVSGVYRGVDVATLLEVSKRSPEELSCCIEIGHSADNTLGNAAETAAWMSRHGFQSLRIVTSNWHMPRSLLEFRHAMPDVALISHPVFNPEVKLERWWAWPGTTDLILREYTKFLFAWLVHLVAGFFTDLPSA